MNWPTMKFEELATKDRHAIVGGPFGSKLTAKDYVDEGVPVIRGANMNAGRYLGLNKFVFVSEEKKTKDLKSNLAKPLDLVFTQRGTLGQVAIIPEGTPYTEFVISQSQMKATLDPERADRDFYYYFFSSNEVVERILNLTSSSGVPHINLGTLKSFEVPTPKLIIQKRIAFVLAAYDDLIENNRRRIALLEEAVRLLYREWFVYFRFPGHEHVKMIDGLPASWQLKSFEDVCDTVGGGTPSTKVPEYWNNADVTWITPTDITRNNCLALLDGEKKISQAGLKKSSAKLVPPYTILMTSRASVGFFGLIDREVCTNQGFINIIPNEEIQRYYLLFNLLHRVEEIRSHASGSTYSEISKGKFRALPITIPTDNLLIDFDERVRPILNQARALKKQTEALAQARDLLLPRLMDGRLEV